MDLDHLAAELSKPPNEPINWLLREVLLDGGRNFISDALLKGGGDPVPHWNELIRAFRPLLQEPNLAVEKIRSEVKLSEKVDKAERDGRLRDVYAECANIVCLNHDQSYSAFEAIPSQVIALPDFRVRHKDKKIGIEVKNLREPTDIIDVIAKLRWDELKQRDPSKYCFPIQVYHLHHSWISDTARGRLCTILDQLPGRKEEVIEEVLDGEIPIRIEKGRPAPASTWRPEFNCSRMMQTSQIYGDPEAGLVIRSAVLEQDLLFDESGFQAFFLKVFRVVANATPKFFARKAEDFDVHLIAVRWEPPMPLIDLSYIHRTKMLIEALFKEIGLSLNLEIYYGNPPLG